MQSFRTLVGALLCALFVLVSVRDARSQEVPGLCFPAEFGANPDDFKPDSAAIQTCLNTGKRVIVYPGKPGYILDRGLKLLVDLTVLESPPPYNKATFVADPNLGYDPRWINHGREQMLFASANHYAIANLLFDGNRLSRDPRLHCREGSRRPANIETHGKGYTAHHIETINAPCGSGFGVSGEDFHIYEVVSSNNGYTVEEVFSPFPPYVLEFPLSDGMTVVYCNGGRIHNVRLIDNTDFDFLVGGGPNCDVRDIDIIHVNRWAIGGFNIGHMDTGHYDPKTGRKWDGDHRGSKFVNIRVTARKGMLGYAHSIGSHTFTHDEPDKVKVYDAGTSDLLFSDGAQVGTIVEGVEKGELLRIDPKNSQGNHHGYNGCRVSADYIAAHFGPEFKLPAGYISRSIHVGDPCPQ